LYIFTHYSAQKRSTCYTGMKPGSIAAEGPTYWIIFFSHEKRCLELNLKYERYHVNAEVNLKS